MEDGKKFAKAGTSESTLPDDAAVRISVRHVAPTDELQRLNSAIASLHESRQAIERLEALARSLGGIYEQIASPKATRRHSVLLSEEASAISREISKGSSLPPPQSRAELDRIRKKNEVKLRELEAEQLSLAREISRLETAHLNSESSHCALRDIDAALDLAASATLAVQRQPRLAVGACSALAARARTLLNE